MFWPRVLYTLVQYSAATAIDTVDVHQDGCHGKNGCSAIQTERGLKRDSKRYKKRLYYFVLTLLFFFLLTTL